MTTTLNRQPVTLANRDPKLYENLWRCTGERARQCTDNDRAGREYSSASAMWQQSQDCMKPAFQPSLPSSIIPSEYYDRLLIDRAKHIANAMNSRPLKMPDYLSELVCDEKPGWQDKVAVWLSVNDDSETLFQYHQTTIGAGEPDLCGEIDLTWFTDGKGDQFWRPFYAVIDGEIYDCRDTTIRDCEILGDTIGWYVTDLKGEPLPDDCETDRLSAGYSSNPTSRLERMLVPGSKPIWHWGLNCFVGRLECWSHPVKLFPETPFYD